MFARRPDLREGDVSEAALTLQALSNPSHGGAEHESLCWLTRSDQRLVPVSLHLLCSDTDDGERAARILERRFADAFRKTDSTRCRGLDDSRPKEFVSKGLRNLVNLLVRTIQRLEREGRVPAIDATGGYKPQIAYAALVGQVMQVPVLYRYASFEDVLNLMPLPVSLDTEVWFDNLWFLERLRDEILRDSDVPVGDPRLTPLLDREDRLVTLSPLGELMAAAADRLVVTQGHEIGPAASALAPEAKKLSYEDGNAGKHPGLDEFCARLVRHPCVTRAATFYYNPDLPKASAVRLPGDRTVDRLEAWYGDGRALTKLRVWTTATTARELAVARAQLARWLGVE
jgi:putative CRISPR-associated protein (TIGR02619 family)